MAVQKAVYQVYINETLSRVVNVAAWSPEDAVEYISDLYNSGDIVLEADDFADSEVGLEDNQPVAVYDADPDYDVDD